MSDKYGAMHHASNAGRTKTLSHETGESLQTIPYRPQRSDPDASYILSMQPTEDQQLHQSQSLPLRWADTFFSPFNLYIFHLSALL